MANDRSLEKTTLKELGVIAQSLGLERWSQLRKAELIEAIRAAQANAGKESVKEERGKSKRARKTTKDAPVESVEEPASEKTGKASKGNESASKRRSRKTTKKEDPAETAEKGETTVKRGRKTAPKTPTLFDAIEEEEKTSGKKTRKPRKTPQKAQTLEQIVSKVVEQVTEHTEQLVAGIVAELQEKQQDVDGAAEGGKKTRGRRKKPAEPVEAPVEEQTEKDKAKAESEPAASPRRGRKRKPEAAKNDVVKEDVLPQQPEEERAEDAKVKAAPNSSQRRKRGNSKKESELVEELEPIEVEPEFVDDAFDEFDAEPKRKRRGRRNGKEKEPEPDFDDELEEEAEVEPDLESPDPIDEEEEEEPIDVESILAGMDDWDEDDPDELNEDDLDDDDFDSVVNEELAAVQTLPHEPEPVDPELSKSSIELRDQMRLQKTIGSPTDVIDKLRLVACDAFWLRAYWQITRQLVDRIRVAMGLYWHTATPILRVYIVNGDEKYASARREFYSDIEIRGGLNSWYVNVDRSPNTFMVELGYRSRDGQFFALASSNLATTPQPSARNSFKQAELEEGAFTELTTRRLPGGEKPARAPKPDDSTPFPYVHSFNGGEGSPFDTRDSTLEIETEVIVKGKVTPGAAVSIREEPIRLTPEGRFTVRYSLPERRHVFPIVMTSPDGVESQTVVLSVDRNTKILDPIFKGYEEE